jgi:DNA-binding transcriptional regulator PaaX
VSEAGADKGVQAMDIRGQATQITLLHLGWDERVASQRSGRTSLHALSELGRAETQQASRRMYAAPTSCSHD